MSQLSDYQRHVEAPRNADYEARIANLLTRIATLEAALRFYADPEHWRTKDVDGNLQNRGYGLGYHRTNPNGMMEVLAPNCGQWMPSTQMVHGGHW